MDLSYQYATLQLVLETALDAVVVMDSTTYDFSIVGGNTKGNSGVEILAIVIYHLQGSLSALRISPPTIS